MRRKEYIMTEYQKEYAVLHHNLVYKYLYVKNLDKDTYYDIVITGYLRAVVKYDEREDLKKYSFTTIAWRAMNTDLCNHWRYLNRAKRKADVLSLNALLPQSEGITLMDTLASPIDISQELADKLFWLEVYSLLDKSQWELIIMRLDGCSRQVIFRQLKIPYYDIDNALINIWDKLKGLFEDNYSELEENSDYKAA